METKEYYKLKQEIKDCHLEMDIKQSYIGELRKELKLVKESLNGIYKSRGELDKLNCKIMRVPNLLKEL